MLTTINTNTGIEAPQEDPAHVEAMVKVAEGTQAPPAATPPTPDGSQEKLFAGKYKTVEELEKGYAELQKAFSQKTATTQEQTPATETKNDNPLKIDDTETPPTAEQAQEALEQKGLDISVFNQEFQEKGELSPESYEKLQKAGIPKEIVDGYIAGQKLIAEQQQTRVFDTAGGQEEYAKMVDWAKTNLSTEERKAYNDTLESGDMNKILLAVRGLRASYEDANGRTPNLVNTTSNGSAGSAPFQSQAQLIQAMSDPRYRTDPAYRAEVEKRLAVSEIF